MDYIYLDSSGKKCVDEITGIDMVPYYSFSVMIDNVNVWCHLEKLSLEWNIHFIELNINIELAHPTDLIWNTDALYGMFDNMDLCKKLAYAIRYVFEYCNRQH